MTNAIWIAKNHILYSQLLDSQHYHSEVVKMLSPFHVQVFLLTRNELILNEKIKQTENGSKAFPKMIIFSMKIRKSKGYINFTIKKAQPQYVQPCRTNTFLRKIIF